MLTVFFTMQRFVSIHAMHTLLLLVSGDGYLYQWDWNVAVTDIKPFTRLATLGLAKEKIAQVRTLVSLYS
jgi:hypothetical protein